MCSGSQTSANSLKNQNMRKEKCVLVISLLCLLHSFHFSSIYSRLSPCSLYSVLKTIAHLKRKGSNIIKHVNYVYGTTVRNYLIGAWFFLKDII